MPLYGSRLYLQEKFYSSLLIQVLMFEASLLTLSLQLADWLFCLTRLGPTVNARLHFRLDHRCSDPNLTAKQGCSAVPDLLKENRRDHDGEGVRLKTEAHVLAHLNKTREKKAIYDCC